MADAKEAEEVTLAVNINVVDDEVEVQFAVKMTVVKESKLVVGLNDVDEEAEAEQFAMNNSEVNE